MSSVHEAHDRTVQTIHSDSALWDNIASTLQGAGKLARFNERHGPKRALLNKARPPDVLSMDYLDEISSGNAPAKERPGHSDPVEWKLGRLKQVKTFKP